MDISTSTPPTTTETGSTQISALKKAIDVTEQNTLKVLESATEQSKEMTAQKTGIGGNLNITG